MRILITGYTGLIGSNLYMHLKEKGMDVDGIGSKDADLTLLSWSSIKIDEDGFAPLILML